ncbi:hypothetical protein O0R41_16745 [Sphingobium naphthae]|uniref:Transposase n=1 Tax=Sphingobium naphthae TaxID=1886786 RepID=A0ABU4A0E9_9SPHN|nr:MULTISPECIES: hypothetical protein [Sphingobium]MBS0503652.1 hypothetical protein [Pseudomonadota bacterium]MDV5825256.1 hypothetical protein [Sphingobium naphthae]
MADRSCRLSRSMAKCGRNAETTRLIAALHDQGKSLATSLAREFDRPARSSYTGDAEPFRRGARDPPASPGSRWFAERIMITAPPPSQEQDREVGISCSKLKAAGGDHRDLLSLGNDGSGRTVSDRILDHREQLSVIARLGVNDGS